MNICTGCANLVNGECEVLTEPIIKDGSCCARATFMDVAKQYEAIASYVKDLKQRDMYMRKARKYRQLAVYQQKMEKEI